MRDWIATRGGIAKWQSADLSRPGDSCLTPALAADGTPTTKPSWHYSNAPAVIVTDPAQVGIYAEELYKAVPVALRRSSNGLSLKITDASQRKVDRLLAACRDKHGSAHYRKGVLPDVTASIGVFYTTTLEPLK
jgi:hypothetical protein